jgi:23S rRNA (cytosine1962-C5)-methyltransferase
MAVRFLPRRWSEAFQAHSISAATLTDLICTDLLELRHRKQRLTHSAGEAFRWVHGDADGLPGIVVDDYSSIVVLQSGSPLGDFLLEFVIAALLKTTEKPIFERSSGQIRALEKLPERTRWIREPTRDQTANIPDTVQTEIAGLSMSFRPLRCQKTGLFLDQKENLELFKVMSARLGAKSMLDLCSYVGAWSCAGAAAGMHEFTLVDQDKDALATASINIAANTPSQLVVPAVTALHGDLFEILAKLNRDKQSFSAVVADPPAFTKSAKHVAEAKRAYQRLTKLASKLVSAGGVYVACSCSRHIGEEDFYEIVSAALDSDDWCYLGRGRQSPDHTVLAADKQSLYLKVLFFERRSSLSQIGPHAGKPRGDAD